MDKLIVEIVVDKFQRNKCYKIDLLNRKNVENNIGREKKEKKERSIEGRKKQR